MRQYDSVVIGGGVAGVAIGALLAKRGYKPVLLEKDSYLGGRSSTFNYQGYFIDTGSHQVASYSSSGMKALFDEVGAKELELVPVRPSIMKYNLATGEYKKASSKESLGEAAHADFKKLVSTIASMSKEEIDSYHDITAEEWLLKRVENKSLLDFFRRITGFAGVGVDELSCGAFLETLNNSFNAELGIGYPKKGGIKAFIDALAEAIIKHGGEIITGVHVDRVKVNGDTVKGIVGRKIESGGLMSCEVDIDAPVIVSAIPVTHIFSIIPREKADEKFVKKVATLTADARVYAGILAGVDESLLEGFGNGQQFFQFTAGKAGEAWHGLVTIPTYVDRDLAPRGYHYIVCNSHGMLPISQKDAVPEHHERIIQLLNQIWPDFNNHLDWLSRVTYFDPLYPPKVKWTGPQNRVGGFVPGLKGMYVAGDAAYLTGSGMGSATKSAWVCISEIEKRS